MAIPYDMSPVLAEFSRRIECFDRFGGIVNHEMKLDQISEPYYIYGVLIPPSEKELQFFDEGEIRSGAIVLYCSDRFTLHFVSEGEYSAPYRQSYVRFEDEEYRVKAVMNRSSDGRYKKWMLTKAISRKIK